MSTLSRYFYSALFCCSICLSSAADTPRWTDIIRAQPYRIAQGMSENFRTIRSWVLFNSGYCEKSDRHILFDVTGKFLGWMQDPNNKDDVQDQLNIRREALKTQGKVNTWLPGDKGTFGYPFAFSCQQPHVEVAKAIDRLQGKHANDLIWGTWDGMTAGSQETPISLAETAKIVWEKRQSQFNEPLNALSFNLFLAQLVIESGAVKSATSRDNAIGILQLRKEVLNDCKIPVKYYRHRMAQVDCAVRLYVLNRRNLQPMFAERFGHLPTQKRERLFGLLLLQTYHSGIGNMRHLLLEGEQSKAAEYFAMHHKQYSADDIVAGMLLHNIGRQPWGWESLFYLIDIELVEQKLTQQ